MAYKIENAIEAFKDKLRNAGANNIEQLQDSSIGKRARNRIITAELDGETFSVIVFPIVLRNQAGGETITDQRYIDINSSAWDQIVSYWKLACLNQQKCLLIALRDIDPEIGDYLFSVEGDLSTLSGRSIYIHANQIQDIRNDLSINVYDVNDERSCKLCLFKGESLSSYISGYENHISSRLLVETINKVMADYLLRNDENTSVVETNAAPEGRHIAYYTTKYERSHSNREAAIRYHGTRCLGCGFDFEERYGERGRGYIEVHHIKPLYELEEEVVVDPRTDLIPLCSNCHRITHRKKNEVLSLEELIRLIQENRNE